LKKLWQKWIASITATKRKINTTPDHIEGCSPTDQIFRSLDKIEAGITRERQTRIDAENNYTLALAENEQLRLNLLQQLMSIHELEDMVSKLESELNLINTTTINNMSERLTQVQEERDILYDHFKRLSEMLGTVDLKSEEIN